MSNQYSKNSQSFQQILFVIEQNIKNEMFVINETLISFNQPLIGAIRHVGINFFL